MARKETAWGVRRIGVGVVAASLFLGSPATHGAGERAAEPVPVAGSTRTRGATCPGGGTAFELTVTGCFPKGCAALEELDWGFGGKPKGIIRVPKFNPIDGDLVQVSVTYGVQYVGTYCVDNKSGGCCLAVVSVNMLTTAQDVSTNDPPVTGLIPFTVDDLIPLTSAGFLLGSSDGRLECFGATKGPPSKGDCTPGEDHFIAIWDTNFVSPTQSVSFHADLAPWIRTAGKPLFVEFETDALGSLGGQFCWAAIDNADLAARVWLAVTYTFCRPGTGYCSGDPGVGTPCPCGNDNDTSVPGAGCANGVFSSGAHLFASGEASVGADSVVLVTTGAEPFETGFFFQADQRVGGGDGAVLGDGLLCASGNRRLLQIRTASETGNVQSSIAVGATGGAVPGDVKRYQYWYRSKVDPPCGPGVNDFNLSNGYEIPWTP